MQTLRLPEYEKLIDHAMPLEFSFVKGQKSHKVLQLHDQSILKLFRLKRLFTSARLYPYTSRFKRNAARLELLGIPTVKIIASYRIPAIKRTAVHYRYLSGKTIRDHCEETEMDSQMAEQFGCFLSFIHQKGVYFRSIHFGNMVLTSGNRIGLIDIADMRFKKRPLSIRLRIRNLRHFFRYENDIDCLTKVRHVFIEAYCKSSQLHPSHESRMRQHFESYFNDRDALAEKSLFMEKGATDKVD
jgi:hypothetical protein